MEIEMISKNKKDITEFYFGALVNISATIILEYLDMLEEHLEIVQDEINFIQLYVKNTRVKNFNSKYSNLSEKIGGDSRFSEKLSDDFDKFVNDSRKSDVIDYLNLELIKVEKETEVDEEEKDFDALCFVTEILDNVKDKLDVNSVDVLSLREEFLIKYLAKNLTSKEFKRLRTLIKFNKDREIPQILIDKLKVSMSEDDVENLDTYIKYRSKMVIRDKIQEEIKRKKVVSTVKRIEKLSVNDEVADNNVDLSNVDLDFDKYSEELVISNRAKTIYELMSQEISYNDISSYMPSKKDDNYYRIFSELLSQLEEEAFVTDELYELEDDEVSKNECVTTKKRIEDNIKFLNEYYSDETNELNDFCSISNKLVFATDKNSEPFICSDLKRIPNEYHMSVGKLLLSLNGDNYRGRKLTNNDKLDNVYEVRAFKIRLLYMPLDNGVNFVLGVNYKKSQNGKENIESISNKRERSFDEYMNFKKGVSDSCLDYNNEVLNTLISSLNKTSKVKDKSADIQ